jgi:hypothetical protein
MMPATYNLEYYRGDTLKFYLNVKDGDGSPTSLSGASVVFTVATGRGSSRPDPGGGFPTSVACTATITDPPNGRIECIITPSHGTDLKAGVAYVYDVEVTKTASEVYTYLTGNINVTEGVS